MVWLKLLSVGQKCAMPFRPQTVKEMKVALEWVREESSIGVAILTGEGSKAFCAGGDQKVRSKGGYVGTDGVPRLKYFGCAKTDSLFT